MSLFQFCLLMYFILSIPYTSEIIWYLSFTDLFISLSINLILTLHLYFNSYQNVILKYNQYNEIFYIIFVQSYQNLECVSHSQHISQHLWPMAHTLGVQLRTPAQEQGDRERWKETRGHSFGFNILIKWGEREKEHREKNKHYYLKTSFCCVYFSALLPSKRERLTNIKYCYCYK